jgi:hypothetical protein
LFCVTRIGASLICGVMRHRALIATLLAQIVFCASAQSYSFAFPLGKRFVLPAANAAPLLSQCSRPAPEGADGFWEPTEAHIDVLEERLVVYLESSVGVELPPRGIAYHRQYIGFVRNGSRFIYGSFYPGREDIAEWERVQPAVVCDGGSSLWGIAYDIDSGTFSDMAFNGVT